MSTPNPPRKTRHRSPIVRSFRLVLRMPSEADERITAADLPESCAALLRTVVKRTRLWPSEKADVARELIDHMHDAIAAEQAPDQIVEHFGNAADAAKLIRRARKRQRHPLLRAWNAAVKVTVISPLVLLALYAVLWIRFNLGDPELSSRYLALIAEARPDPGQGAPPYLAYEHLSILWSDTERHLIENAPADAFANRLYRDMPSLKPDHPLYDAVAETTRSLRDQIDAAARETHRPGHGTPVVTEIEFPPQSRTQSAPIAERRASLVVFDPDHRPPLSLGVLLPHAQWMHHTAALLAFDASLAAHEGDRERFLNRIHAVFGLAAQISTDEILISNLIAQHFHELACTQIAEVLSADSQLLNDRDLANLSHAVAASSQRVHRLSLLFEQAALEDVLQRCFTDNGRGDGRLINESLEIHRMLHALTPPSITKAEPFHEIVGPVASLLVAGRADQREEMSEVFSVASTALQAGPAGMPIALAWQREFDDRYESILYRARYFVSATLTPNLMSTIGNKLKKAATSDATLIALAIESHRRGAGNSPAAITDLVPRYLPAVPEDPFAPGTPLRLWTEGDTIIIYSVGEDGDDDGATPLLEADGDRADHSFRVRWSGVPKQQSGDWILYPPAN
ncbi:MAG: hypothetical protein AAF937_06245 [Planctomycetota bacterium]